MSQIMPHNELMSMFKDMLKFFDNIPDDERFSRKRFERFTARSEFMRAKNDGILTTIFLFDTAVWNEMEIIKALKAKIFSEIQGANEQELLIRTLEADCIIELFKSKQLDSLMTDEQKHKADEEFQGTANSLLSNVTFYLNSEKMGNSVRVKKPSNALLKVVNEFFGKKGISRLFFKYAKKKFPPFQIIVKNYSHNNRVRAHRTISRTVFRATGTDNITPA